MEEMFADIRGTEVVRTFTGLPDDVVENLKARTIENVSWINGNCYDKLREFVDKLHGSVGLYSPSLGLVVMFGCWTAGNEVYDITYDFVYASPGELEEHIDYLTNGGEDMDDFVWTEDILADFDHQSFSLYENGEESKANLLLATVFTAPDWTSDPFGKVA